MSIDEADDEERQKQTIPLGNDTRISPSRAHADPVIGTDVSGYVVKGRLGSGGMGIVYEGEQPVIGKRVAIKVLRPEVAENPDVVQRLVAEARAVNAVGHRNIIDVFGFGELPDGRQCIVMEYLDGESLEAVLKAHAREHRVMTVHEVLIILDEVLGALAAAHAAGVIHRDLKPSNIFLCRQRNGSQFVKLLDFGIAKLGVLGSPTPQTRASLLMGTPSYMAPEQARGGPVGPAMDLYAMGIIAYEMLTGRLPFTAESVVEMLLKHANETPAPPSRHVMSIPDDLDELVLKLLSKRPEDRYPSADTVRDYVVRLRKELADPTAQRTDRLPAVRPEEHRVDVVVPGAGAASPGVVVSPSLQQLAAIRSPASSGDDVALADTTASRRGPPQRPARPPAAPRPAPEPEPSEPEPSEPEAAVGRSRGPLYALLAVAVLLLVGGLVALTRAGPSEVTAPPATAAPGPTRAEPKPAIAEAPPVVVDARPIVAEPKAVVAEPKAVVAEPKAIVAEPKAVVAEPRPVVAEPKPVVAEPRPVAAEPRPIVAAPKPAAPAPPERQPTPAPKAVAGGKPSLAKAMQGRVKKLNDRLVQAEADGANVAIYRRQVEKVAAALSGEVSPEDLERLENLVARLEASTEF